MIKNAVCCLKFGAPFWFFAGFLLLQACGATKDYYNLQAFSTSDVANAVIEIPAGTNKKVEYNVIEKKFIIDRESGQERVIDYLPYPANYGFIPSTLSKTGSGGDGDALDVLVIAETHSVGTVMKVLPIALLKLIDDGEIDYKIIAVPAAEKKQIVNVTSYENLVSDYPELLKIIELWFLNYNKKDVSRVDGWGDEKEAVAEIRRNLKN